MTESVQDSATTNVQAATSVDPVFVEQVKQALEHLYDFPYLQHHPLAQQAENLDGPKGATAGQRLRKELIAAVESLGPEPGVSFRAAPARTYSMLQLRYIEGLTVLEAAHQLSISPRQAHRELRHGEESVAELLWARFTAFSHNAQKNGPSSVQSEIARLGTHVGATDIRVLLARALRAVEKLAQVRSISFEEPPAETPVMVSADAIAAQQIMVSLLSYVVKQAQPGNVQLSLEMCGDIRSLIHLSITYRVQMEMISDLDPVVEQLAQRLSWRVCQQEGEASTRMISLYMPVCSRTILVIDDNEGLVALLERYLASYTCRVVKADSGIEGMQLAQELFPDAIILDIMLPQVDGWEVLQTLRNDPETSAIPIVVCSVINDPELAASLGASLLVPKPVSCDAVLKALQQVGVL
ncbi:MAG: response regulator [Chloroflexi bacterium]|nr:response regulator [Chloroflexota bacterium]